MDLLLPVDPLTGSDAVGAPAAPSFGVSITSIKEDQTDATGVRVATEQFRFSCGNDESWLMTISEFLKRGPSKGAGDSSSGDWYTVLPQSW